MDLLKYLPCWFVQVAHRDGTIEFDLPVEAAEKELFAFIIFMRAEGKGKIFTISNSRKVG